MKNIILLGATGSIGSQTLDVIRSNKEKFKILGLSLGRDLEKSRIICEEFKPLFICLREKCDFELSYNPTIFYGEEGLLKLASIKGFSNELLVNALVGYIGLKPTYKAISNNINVALANKETLVMAGDIIMPYAKEKNVKIIPIDSEHSAILQCIKGEKQRDIKKLIITASGGSFRDKTRDELSNVTLEDALNHPNWSMGTKITIDSATMMNKGFEVIEAHHLFSFDYDSIKTVMHRQSIIHSLVEFNDLSVKAVLATADMRMPILYALSYPNHPIYDGKPLNLVEIGKLTFEELSHERFKCLEYAYEAGKKGGLYPCALNAANEAAVGLFIKGKISFLDIEKIIEEELLNDYTHRIFTLDEIIKLDREIQCRVNKKYGGIE